MHRQVKLGKNPHPEVKLSLVEVLRRRLPYGHQRLPVRPRNRGAPQRLGSLPPPLAGTQEAGEVEEGRRPASGGGCPCDVGTGLRHETLAAAAEARMLPSAVGRATGGQGGGE